MQIFYLDRENEDLLRKIAEPPADRAQFTRFAEADEIDEFHGVEDQADAPTEEQPPDQEGEPPPPVPPPDPPDGRLA